MKSSSLYFYVVASIIIMGGINFGFDIAIVAGAIPFMQKYFGWNELELGWAVSSLLVGCIAGSFLSGPLCARYGRKKVLIYISLVFGLSCIGTGIAHTDTFFIAMRLIGGISVGAISVLSPMFVAEISPSRVRGRMTAIYQLCIMAGILISYIVNFFLKDVDGNWRLMFISGIVPSAIFFIGLFFVPESPRYLVIKGRVDEARAVLMRIVSKDECEKAISDLTVAGEQKATGSVFSIFTKENSKVLTVGIILAVLVQLIGCNAALDYAPKIMMATGLSIDDALYFNIFMGVINLIATVVGVTLIDLTGRRKLYIVGSTVMGLSLFALGLSFHHMFNPYILLICLFAYIACFSACIGPTFWTLIAEMFPNKIRAQSVAFMSFTQWIFNFLVVWLFPHFLESVGGATTFYFFAIMCTIQLFVAIFMVKETKGKSLEQIELMWQEKNT